MIFTLWQAFFWASGFYLLLGLHINVIFFLPSFAYPYANFSSA